MMLFRQHLLSERLLLLDNSIRLRAIGDRARLPRGVRRALEETEIATASGRTMDLILALSYGGRDELVHAMRSVAADVAAGLLDPALISQDDIRQRLYAPDVPDPDLLVRTSNEYRVSNFLLWQLAYAELVVSPVPWPAFGPDHFVDCINEYALRERRFGLTSEQQRVLHQAVGA